MEGISMEKEECREPPKRAPNPFRVLNLSGKLGFLTGGITFTLATLSIQQYTNDEGNLSLRSLLFSSLFLSPISLSPLPFRPSLFALFF